MIGFIKQRIILISPTKNLKRFYVNKKIEQSSTIKMKHKSYLIKEDNRTGDAGRHCATFSGDMVPLKPVIWCHF
jgi:hypothetical protein